VAVNRATLSRRQARSLTPSHSAVNRESQVKKTQQTFWPRAMRLTGGEKSVLNYRRSRGFRKVSTGERKTQYGLRIVLLFRHSYSDVDVPCQY